MKQMFFLSNTIEKWWELILQHVYVNVGKSDNFLNLALKLTKPLQLVMKLS